MLWFVVSVRLPALSAEVMMSSENRSYGSKHGLDVAWEFNGTTV